MKITLTPNLKLLFLQLIFTAAMVIPFQTASAEIVTVAQEVNTYLEKGDTPINLVQELDITDNIKAGSKVLKVAVKAQGLSSDSSVTLMVNKKPAYKVKLTDRFSHIKLKMKSQIKVHNVSIKAESAFVEVAAVDILADAPQVDDFSQIAQ